MTSLRTGAPSVRCFHARAGGAYVAGASFSYRAEGDIVSLAQTDDDALAGCIEITAHRTGQVGAGNAQRRIADTDYFNRRRCIYGDGQIT